jgi:ferredoxin-NADP reductase
VYICGIKEMVQDVTAALLELGVERKSVFTEKFV